MSQTFQVRTFSVSLDALTAVETAADEGFGQT